MIEVSGSRGEIRELVCTICGFHNSIGEKYCSECGESLASQVPLKDLSKEQKKPVPKPKTLVCRNCGTEAKEEKKFCAECGKALRPRHTNPNQNVATQSAVNSKKSFGEKKDNIPSLLPPNSILQGRYQI